MALIADTSGLLASINRNDAAHAAVRDVLESETDAVIVPELVLAEVDYMLLKHLGREAEESFIEDVLGGVYVREPLTDQDVHRGLSLIRRYREHDIGLVDATLLSVAERFNVPRVLTLDRRHFRILKFKDRKDLQLLPDDAHRDSD